MKATFPSKEVLAPAIAIAATLAVHGIALGSDFQDEDLRHIFEIQKYELYPYLVRPYGNHFCASFRLATVFLYWAFGLHAFGFFAFMLLIHLLDVGLLYGIVRNFGGAVSVAALVAGMWGAAPAFQGSLQWFAALSHLLGTTAALWPLWELSRAATLRRPPSAWAIAGMGLVIVAGAGTELTGSLTAVLFPLVAVLVLTRESGRIRTALWLSLAAGLSLFLVVKFAAAANSKFFWFFAWSAVGTMFAELVAYGTGMVVLAPLATVGANDDTWLLHGSVASAVWIGAACAIPALVLVLFRLVRGDWTERRNLMAMLGLAGGLYGAVAAGRSGLTFGHALEWMSTRDRYHYDASAFMWAAIGVSLAKGFPRLERVRSRALAVAFGSVALTWIVSGSFAARATYLRGGGRQEWTRDWSNLVDESIRLMLVRVPENGVLYVRNEFFRPGGLLFAAMGAPHSDLPGIGAYWITAHGFGAVNGRTLRFAELEPVTLDRIRAESRPELARMFVSPEEVVRAGGIVRTIERNVPPGVFEYIEGSPDPLIERNDHELALRLRATIRNAIALPPIPWAPATAVVSFPRPVAKPPPPPEPEPTDPQERDRLAFKKAFEADPHAKERLRKAIEASPEAMEQIKKAILADPKAREEMQRELLEGQDQAEH